jgi:hypothetical protein
MEVLCPESKNFELPRWKEIMSDFELLESLVFELSPEQPCNRPQVDNLNQLAKKGAGNCFIGLIVAKANKLR